MLLLAQVEKKYGMRCFCTRVFFVGDDEVCILPHQRHHQLYSQTLKILATEQ
jgi:hypothetical protein